MGYNICGIAINSLPKFDDIGLFDKKKLKTKFSKTHINQLNPKQLSIAFKADRTVILLDMIFYQNISESSELSNLEKDLNDIFPNSEFLIFAINDTIDFACYSIVKNGVKIRTKGVAKDDFFLDYGELLPIEIKLYDQIMDYFKANPDQLQSYEKKFSSFTNLEKQKRYIIVRDLFYQRILKKENKLNYTDGSLDSYIIEAEFKKVFNCDFNDLETIEFIEFDRRRLNFKKDSLKEYLYLAKSLL